VGGKVKGVTDFMTYQLRQVERREAYEKLNYASTLLDLRQIKERAAELASQHEPTATFSGGDADVRQRILWAVHYVLTGRKEDPHDG
jgi:hypothetical protein